LAQQMGDAVESWRDDVRRGVFPSEDNVFSDD
jgi:ketopantoate hydroxymethyltransferase